MQNPLFLSSFHRSQPPPPSLLSSLGPPEPPQACTNRRGRGHVKTQRHPTPRVALQPFQTAQLPNTPPFVARPPATPELPFKLDCCGGPEGVGHLGKHPKALPGTASFVLPEFSSDEDLETEELAISGNVDNESSPSPRSSETPEQLLVGTLVAFQLPGSCIYHRGVVENVAIKVKIWMLDVGVSVFLPLKHLYLLKAHFTRIPPFAMSCKIVDLAKSGKSQHELHLMLRSILWNTGQRDLKVEIVIFRVSKPRYLGLPSRLFLEVLVLVDGTDLSVKLEHCNPKAHRQVHLPGPEMVDSASSDDLSCETGSDSQEYYFELAEKFSY